MHRHMMQGVLWAVPFVAIALALEPDQSLTFLALLLTFIAGVYLGFALMDPERGRLVIEFTGIVVTCSLAAAGLWVRPQFLAAGYAFHAVWDLLHHPGPLPTRTPVWYAHGCTSFDLVVGGFILYLWR